MADEGQFWTFRRKYLTLIVFIMNADVLMTILKYHGFSPVLIFSVVMTVSTLELFYWYKFIGEAIQAFLKTQPVQHQIDFGKKVAWELSRAGILEFVKQHFIRLYYKANDENSRVVRLIKTYGHFAIWAIAASPFPTERFLCLIFCRIFNWRRGFYSLLIANTLHFLVVYGLLDLASKMYGSLCKLVS